MLVRVRKESGAAAKNGKSPLHTCAILGIGIALPPYRMAQDDAAETASKFCCSTAEQAHWLSVVFRRARVQTRYVAVPAEPGNGPPFYPPPRSVDDRGPTTAMRVDRYKAEAPRLAFDAAVKALESSGVPPGEISHLVTVSCTGFAAPGVDISLIKSLDLARTVQRTHVGFMGCHGALNGLRVVRAITGAEPTARVLMCAVEISSVHFQYGWNPDQIVASALFADGAAALVGGSSDAPGAWNIAANGSCLLPNSEDAMTWRIGDHGFEMTLSEQVPELIRGHLGAWLDDWLAQQDLRVEQIGSWAVHPGGPRILSAVEQALALNPSTLTASWEILRECGNMSSPTVLFILDRLRRARARRPCVALGFGPGLIAEAVLFR